MKFHNITNCDILNGEGVRVVLWVSGCSHHCKGCHNAITWDENDGLIFDENAKKELFTYLSSEDINGITFSGGDPLFMGNREEIGKLIEEVSVKFPSKNIWLYTGYLWEDIKHLPFIKFIDVIVDGRFEQDKFDATLLWKGSSNQRVIDVKQSLKTNNIVLHCK